MLDVMHQMPRLPASAARRIGHQTLRVVTLRFLIVGAVVAVLAACGGRSTDTAPSPPTGPTPPAPPAAPFYSSIYLDPDIITPSDPTTFHGLTPRGQGLRSMFDWRVARKIQVNAWLFDAMFSDGLSAEVQVNPEFGEDAARAEAEKYTVVIGRLPQALRVSRQFVMIHRGVHPAGGGSDGSLLIHTDQAVQYEAGGFLEEILVHETAHTSLDAIHALHPQWLSAQSSDPGFISTYARDNPGREDVAESFLMYLIVRYRLERISQSVAATALQTIPNRIAYFDSLRLTILPVD